MSSTVGYVLERVRSKPSAGGGAAAAAAAAAAAPSRFESTTSARRRGDGTFKENSASSRGKTRLRRRVPALKIIDRTPTRCAGGLQSGRGQSRQQSRRAAVAEPGCWRFLRAPGFVGETLLRAAPANMPTICYSHSPFYSAILHPRLCYSVSAAVIDYLLFVLI